MRVYLYLACGHATAYDLVEDDGLFPIRATYFCDECRKARKLTGLQVVG